MKCITPGTVFSHKLQIGNLIPTFHKTLWELYGDDDQISSDVFYMHYQCAMYEEDRKRFVQTFGNEETVDLLCRLISYLSELASDQDPDLYFGTHPNDKTTYGFWYAPKK